jgi:hypothetical protein
VSFIVRFLFAPFNSNSNSSSNSDSNSNNNMRFDLVAREVSEELLVAFPTQGCYERASICLY